MTKSKRLEPVARIAENRERRAATELAKARQRLEEQEARLRELTSYRDDYSRRFQEAGLGDWSDRPRLRYSSPPRRSSCFPAELYPPSGRQ